MDAPPGGSNTETLIAACTAMLSRRRFSTSRDFALRLPPSDPSAHQILVVAEVLSAADRRDWYAVLQLRPTDFAVAGADSFPRQQFKKLALLLDPNTNTFPFSAEALTCLLEAWHVLSDPQRRQLYDREIAGECPPPPPQQQHLRGTFWTACPYCWNMYEYEDGYEDCALRCEGCRKVFQGVAVKPPVGEETAVVEGERREYYRCNASVPLRYYEVLEMNGEEEEEDKNFGGENIVYISDDDDVVFGREGVKGDDVRNVGCNNGRVELQGNNGNNGKKGMRVKTVAKKVGGNRMRRQGCVDVDNDLGLDLDADDGGELEFTQGDDGDIFVGVRFSK